MLLKLAPLTFIHLVESINNSTNTLVNYDEIHYKQYVNGLGIIFILQLVVLFCLPCYK